MYQMVSRVLLCIAVLLAVSCKCKYSALQVPKYLGTKVHSYTFAGYTDKNGKKTFRLYVTDTIYTADAKKYFDIFQNAIIINPKAQ